MSRKLNRWLLAGALAAGFVAPMLPAQAAGPGIDVAGEQFGNGKQVDTLPNQEVTWYIKDGTHTVSADPDTPGQKWPAKDSGDLDPKDHPSFSVTFTTPGTYNYKCEQVTGMKGSILVKDDAPPPPPPSTTTTMAPTTTTTTAAATPAPTTPTTAAPATSAGARPSGTAAPAPTTTTAPKDKKGKDDKKEEETTTTTVAPPPPPIDLPDSAIIPVLPGAVTGSTTQNGVEAPMDTPEGDAIALLKSKKSGGQATKLLLLSGFGLGALGLGTAGYKYANRSSKYFPA